MTMQQPDPQNIRDSAPAPNSGHGQSRDKPIRRRYPAAPLVGVAAAVFDDAGRVLLVQRGRPPSAGDWGLPGGLLDLGETLANGARREVREECDIEIEIGGVIGAFEPIHYDSDGRVEYHYVVVDFWAVYTSGDVTPADDARAAVWSGIDELEGFKLRPDTRQIILDAHQAWSEQRGSQSGTTRTPETESNPAHARSGLHP